VCVLSVASPSDSYAQVWKRVREGDWRTSAKALFILHRLLRDCRPEDSEAFAQEFRHMAHASFAAGAGADWGEDLRIVLASHHGGDFIWRGREVDLAWSMCGVRWPTACWCAEGMQPELLLDDPDPSVRSWLEAYTAYLSFRTSDANEVSKTRPINTRDCDPLRPSAHARLWCVPSLPPGEQDLARAVSGAATTPYRRRLASVLSSANRLIGLGLRCRSESLGSHPVVAGCVACVGKVTVESSTHNALKRIGLELWLIFNDLRKCADLDRVVGGWQDLLDRCRQLCTAAVDLDEMRGDLIDEILHHEACSYRLLLPQVHTSREVCQRCEDRCLILTPWLIVVSARTGPGLFGRGGRAGGRHQDHTRMDRGAGGQPRGGGE
jgi:hypothetical protein